MTGKRLAGLLIVVAAVAVATPPVAAGDGRPDFSGSWQLNDMLSDDPELKMREAMRQRGGPGGGMGGPGMGGRGGGIGGPPGGGMGKRGGGMGGPPGGDREAMRERMRELREGIEKLEITHEEPAIVIRYGDGREQVLHADGNEYERDGGPGPVRTRTRWRKDRLVVLLETERGRKIREVWELQPDTGRILVTVRLGGDGRAPELSFRRFYDPIIDQPDDAAEES